jgi:hypothetical protein
MGEFEIVGWGGVSVRWLPTAGDYQQILGEPLQVLASNEPGEKILNLVSIKCEGKSVEITGEFVDYRLFELQRQNPRQSSKIHPVGVSGITVVSERGKEFLLFARRGKGVTQYPSLYELAPSGGLSDKFARSDGTVDFAGQLLVELMEECKISADMVAELAPLAVVFDRREKVYDICCRLMLNADRETILAGLTLSGEYDNVFWVAAIDAERFIRANKKNIVPASEGIISAYQSRRG